MNCFTFSKDPVQTKDVNPQLSTVHRFHFRIIGIQNTGKMMQKFKLERNILWSMFTVHTNQPFSFYLHLISS